MPLWDDSGQNIKISEFLLDFRVSSVLQSLLLEGVAFRGCEGGAGGLEFHQ